jgi:hypothetical protein
MLLGGMQRNRARVVTGVGLAATFLGSVLASGAIQDAQVEESKARGDRIAAALATHRQRVGAYPHTLAQLVPADLAALPVTAMGVVRTFHFAYEGIAGDDYVVRFEQPGWTGWQRGVRSTWTVYD